MRRLLLAGVVLLLSASLATATTLVRLDFDDLVEQADRIVIGTVEHTQGFWEETGTFVHTDVTLSVDRNLRGRGPSEIVLRTPGGVVGGTGQVFHGAATFEIGERVLVFLTTWEDGTPKVLGYAQGKSRIFVDERGRQRLRGGTANGLALETLVRDITRGSDHNVPLRPAN